MRVFGVDFSGGVTAGRKIWLAGGSVAGGVVRVDTCCRGDTLSGSGRDRDRCMLALRSFIAAQSDAVFGFDFPFGLPAPLVKQRHWRDFALAFRRQYRSADDLRRRCLAGAEGAELKRRTDMETRTPFSPYNLRIYRQTYFGIRGVLAPLVRAGAACVVPMQPPRPHRPWLIEVCPAVTLKGAGLYVPYKGRSAACRAARRRIVRWLAETRALSLPSAVRARAVGDPEGDALDSILAAFATFRSLPQVRHRRVGARGPYAREGYVYA